VECERCASLLIFLSVLRPLCFAASSTFTSGDICEVIFPLGVNNKN